MDNQTFNEVVGNRLEKTKGLLIKKAGEYATGTNRLHNFFRAAEVSGQTPERCLNGFLLKHLVSYFDMLDRIDKGEVPTQEFIDEKIGDIVTYFCLQEAVIIERLNNMR